VQPHLAVIGLEHGHLAVGGVALRALRPVATVAGRMFLCRCRWRYGNIVRTARIVRRFGFPFRFKGLPPVGVRTILRTMRTIRIFR